MTRLAVFDCDGTLVDSQANICRAMEEAFAAARLAPPMRRDIRRIVGLSLVEAVTALLPDADPALHRSLAAAYKANFFRMRSSGELDPEPLFDGIGDVIAGLLDAGWLLGIATGKSDRGLTHILAHHALTAHFVTLQTADRHPSKPDPAMLQAAIDEVGASPETTVMIGDTSFDMVMARSAGARAIGVAWGYHPAEELLATGAHSVADSPRALMAHLA